ncbi:synapse-associated protein of 47 kDa isoform X2 [Ctenocephalides felis]|uniref:synapse-associated protein of 47 kDa isoform X2 n=1 Tax=Ctenocephalides felis TaxID=7515 RepID=UPI000E6E38F1|nr:synapse-associated protein of 47 kDa isoform X2 [Ctenocephalides felis]
MFTGLTSQVSSWMGAAKGETQEEDVPTPTAEADVELNTDGDKKQSPTKTSGSRLEMFTNVKSQMTGWLGNASIPGLRKGDDQQQGAGDQQQPANTADQQQSATATEKADTGVKDEDDNSSATGGADSGPASAANTPTDEQAGQLGAVTNKAVAGVKSFGGFLYSAVNKAGAKVSEAGAKIKKTVEENNLLGEFNKEQEAFIKGQQSNTAAAVPPWAGHPNEEALKEECLGLSTDRRNFVRAPPAGVDFAFDYDVSYPTAIAIMAEDPNLEEMRFELVPKIITEENFWRNYFYRVSLICQAHETQQTDKTLASEGDKATTGDFKDSETKLPKSMNNLEIDVSTKEEDWERELEAELQDYEVVNESAGGSAAPKTDDDLLDDEPDLK